MSCRSKKRHREVRLLRIFALAIAATISSYVIAGCSLIRPRISSSCSSSSHTDPPLGLGAMLPVAWYRCAQMITTPGLSPNYSAVSRRDDARGYSFNHRFTQVHRVRLGVVPPPKRINAADSRILKPLNEAKRRSHASITLSATSFLKLRMSSLQAFRIANVTMIAVCLNA
jgi:hypothetical protein